MWHFSIFKKVLCKFQNKIVKSKIYLKFLKFSKYVKEHEQIFILIFVVKSDIILWKIKNFTILERTIFQ
jgi:hypothetical protein